METIRKCLVTKANDVTKEGIVTVAVNGIGIEDSQHDISMPGSFVKTLKNMQRKRWLYNHDYTQLLGVPISGEETKDDLIMVGKINTKKQLGRDVLSDYELYAENGRTLEHSIGVIAKKRNAANKKEVLEWDLMEYSTLSAWGSNPRTGLIDIKSDRETIRDRADLIRMALKKHYSDERLEKFDTELNLLLKSLEGATIVKCPCCHKEFDYDGQEEKTAKSEVSDMAYSFLKWLDVGDVKGQMAALREDLRSDLLSLLDSYKGDKEGLDEKAIEGLLKFVRCPECFTRVYKSDAILKDKKEDEEKPEEEPEEENKPEEEEESKPADDDESKKKSFWSGLDTIFK